MHVYTKLPLYKGFMKHPQICRKKDWNVHMYIYEPLRPLQSPLLYSSFVHKYISTYAHFSLFAKDT